MTTETEDEGNYFDDDGDALEPSRGRLTVIDGGLTPPRKRGQATAIENGGAAAWQ